MLGMTCHHTMPSPLEEAAPGQSHNPAQRPAAISSTLQPLQAALKIHGLKHEPSAERASSAVAAEPSQC